MKTIVLFALLLCFCEVSNSQSWVQIFTANNSYLTDIKFLDANTGYHSGRSWNGPIGSGGVSKSTNGGANWFNVFGGLPVNSVYFINQNTGWIAGGYYDDIPKKSREIFKTTNGGLNFTRQFLDSNQNTLNAVQFANYDVGFVLSQNGILYTSNSGNNWISRNVPGTGSTNMYFVNSSTGYASGYINGSQSYFCKTTNAGINWSAETMNGIIIDIFFINENTGWVSSSDGKLFRTTDGWNSRTTIEVGYTNISNIFFYGAATGWMCGGNGQMYYTNNGGINWISQNTGISAGLFSVFFVNPNTGWVLGNQFVNPYLMTTNMYKTTNGGISALNNISSEVPEEYSLSQNYPNPFNPTTNIEFRIADLGFVSLTIYDAMGRVVETLQNGGMKPGVYQAQWNAAEYPSGVYFYRLSANGFTQTRKLILIK